MTDSNSNADVSTFDAHRLHDLAAAVCDDLIAPAEFQELQQILLATSAAREQFLGDVCVHAGLEWDMAARGRLESLIDSCRQSDAGGGQRSVAAPVLAEGTRWRNRKVRLFAYWATAAALLLSTSLFSPGIRERLFGPSQADDVAHADGSTSQPADMGAEIATISGKSADSRWMFDAPNITSHSQGAGRTEIRTGETLRVTAGTLQLAFNHGTTVSLTAPAILEVATPMRGRLIRGRATVNVAKGAEGFTINTPRTSVVDLGTVFGVEVDDIGRTDVVVFSGIVDVTYSSEAQATANAELGKLRLHTGEAMRVDERGTLSRIISLNSNRFADARAGTPAALSRKRVISSVRDNIEREDAWNFYEIVQEGFGEDAKAFVDRVHHEWNGINAQGMPAYLVGGDFVKSFNDDKNIGTIEVSVKLEQPANLYVLWCKRVPAPSWLREEFEETGDEIGVDEGRHVFRDGTVHNRDGPGVGAGVSVDSIHTIWRRTVNMPSVVRLGPVEAPGWDFNMYGIVAVPLKKNPR
jgi:hypothetical protein